MSYKKMDPAVKSIWVAALRSGEFDQAREILADGAGYCCLGVLCTVAEQKELGIVSRDGFMQKEFNLAPEISTMPQENGDSEFGQVYDDEWQDGELSDEMREHFGISKNAHNRLISMNDGSGVPQRDFGYIADWIEKCL